MGNNEILARLEQLAGQRVNRSGVTHVVKSYALNEEDNCYQIVTDHEVFKLHKGRMADWFKGTIVEGAANQPAFREPHFYQPAVLNSNTLGMLRDELMDNIRKVKADPAYRETASAVKSNIDSLINIAKVEATALSAMARISEWH